MVQVKNVHTRRRDDGYVVSEARVEAQSGDRINAGDLDLETIDYAQVTVEGAGAGSGSGADIVLTRASIASLGATGSPAFPQIEVGLASVGAFAGGGSLFDLTSGSAVLSVRARDPSA